MTTNSINQTEMAHLRPAPLPTKAHKLALRMLQLAKEPGEYPFVLIVDENGRWQLKPPPDVEELGL